MIAEGMEKEEPRRRRRCWLHDVELPANGECDECSKLMPVRRSVTVTVFADGDDDGYRGLDRQAPWRLRDQHPEDPQPE
jgi:hypothetical protein